MLKIMQADDPGWKQIVRLYPQKQIVPAWGGVISLIEWPLTSRPVYLCGQVHHMHARMHTHACTQAHKCMHTQAHVQARAHTHTHTHAQRRTTNAPYTHARVHTYTYTHIHTFTFAHLTRIFA
jgi:hypothetical protein